MFAVQSPAAAPCISTSSWTLEDLIIPQYYHHHQENDDDDDFGNISTTSRETETSDMLLPSPSSSCARNNNGELISPSSGDHVPGDDGRRGSTTTSKKINHNANERERRKRVNNMYSHLRSLLPAADQTKKLSIPGTVSEVLQYIPQLQMEVERLINEKEKLLSNISMIKAEDVHIRKKRKKSASPSTAISVTSLGHGREVLVQISAVKAIDKKLILSTLEHLEEENELLLLNASSFESSSGDRAFNSLHLQVQGNNRVESEILREKLLLFLEKMEAAQLH